MTTQATTEAVVGLVKTLVSHPELEGVEWQSIAVVACTRPDQAFAHRMYGYTYTADDITPAKLSMKALSPHYEQLIAATAREGEPMWQKCLLQFDTTGRSNLQFEYEDESRWTSNPADLWQLPNELRPEFDAPEAPADS